MDTYRPSSSLHSLYKVHATVLSVRVAEAGEPHMQSTQNGFRRGRSTAHPLHCVRRVLTILGTALAKGITVFPKPAKDLAKALTAPVPLSCGGLRRNRVRGIGRGGQSCFDVPMFRICSGDTASERHSQDRGSRHGCQLSPYLRNIATPSLWHMVRVVAAMERGVNGGPWDSGIWEHRPNCGRS